jgi:hypothetical protein
MTLVFILGSPLYLTRYTMFFEESADIKHFLLLRKPKVSIQRLFTPAHILAKTIPRTPSLTLLLTQIETLALTLTSNTTIIIHRNLRSVFFSTRFPNNNYIYVSYFPTFVLHHQSPVNHSNHEASLLYEEYNSYTAPLRFLI